MLLIYVGMLDTLIVRSVLSINLPHRSLSGTHLLKLLNFSTSFLKPIRELGVCTKSRIYWLEDKVAENEIKPSVVTRIEYQCDYTFSIDIWPFFKVHWT